MAKPRTSDPATLTRELTAALGVLTGARRALADHHLPHLRQLTCALERIEAMLGSLPEAGRDHLQAQLLAMLDEAASLAEDLSAEHARTRAALHRTSAERLAGRAYRRTSRL